MSDPIPSRALALSPHHSVSLLAPLPDCVSFSSASRSSFALPFPLLTSASSHPPVRLFLSRASCARVPAGSIFAGTPQLGPSLVYRPFSLRQTCIAVAPASSIPAAAAKAAAPAKKCSPRARFRTAVGLIPTVRLSSIGTVRQLCPRIYASSSMSARGGRLSVLSCCPILPWRSEFSLR